MRGLCLLLCLKTLLRITCFLCSLGLFAWDNPQCHFKLELIFSVSHAKNTPWMKRCALTWTREASAVPTNLVEAAALRLERLLSPCIVCCALRRLSGKAVCADIAVILDRQTHELRDSIMYWYLHYRKPFYPYNLGIRHVVSEEVGDFPL